MGLPSEFELLDSTLMIWPINHNNTNMHLRQGCFLSLFVAPWTVGCGPDLPPETEGSGAASTSTSEPLPGSSSDPSATGIGSTGADPTSTTMADAGTTDDAPEECMSNPKLSCDPLDPEACYGELKCTYDYHPKGGSWVCGCIRGDAGPYEPCTWDPTPSDTCAPQQICSGGDSFGPDTCTPLCGTALCSETSVCLGDYCVEPCDPLAPYACPPGAACAPSYGGFVCGGNIQPRPAGVGEPCESEGGCEHGLVCQPGSEVTGCTTDQCCAAVCDTMAPEPCAPGEACVPLFDRPWPGSETLGACAPA